MIKQSLIYLVLSILVILFAKYANIFIVYIDMIFAYLNLKLAPIFSNTGTGKIIREIIVLVFLPVIIVGIPALIYQAIKKKKMPYFFEIVWFVWLVIVLSKILVY